MYNIHVPLEISAGIIDSFWKTLGGLYSFAFGDFKGGSLSHTHDTLFVYTGIELDEGVCARETLRVA